MRVIIFSRAVYKPVVEVLLLEAVAVALGVGNAAKSFAESISILKLVNGLLQAETIMTPNAVGVKLVSKKRTIVLEDITAIAVTVGLGMGILYDLNS